MEQKKQSVGSALFAVEQRAIRKVAMGKHGDRRRRQRRSYEPHRGQLFGSLVTSRKTLF